MNSQNTPVHIKLWHREFWQMAIANLLLSMSVYMLIPVLPLWLTSEENFSSTEIGLSMGIFAVGLYLMGPFVSYLVQRYRRNVVCQWAIVVQVLALALLLYINSKRTEFVDLWLVLVERFVLGAAFGMAQMVLSSTLIIDTCESYQRTEANHSASWFGRFALSLGPLAGLLVLYLWDFHIVIFVAMGCAFLSLLLISAVTFPFRAPEEHVHLFSNDRFMLGQGGALFVNLLLITLAIGIMLSRMDAVAYGILMVGFLMALLAQRFAFKDAELKSEVVTGLILLMAAQLIILTQHTQTASYIASAFTGMATGIIGSRFLLFFIKLSRHCQRGTSQSTFMLAWETGLALGVGLSYLLVTRMPYRIMWLALALSIAALVMYNVFTHGWFMKHKNR